MSVELNAGPGFGFHVPHGPGLSNTGVPRKLRQAPLHHALGLLPARHGTLYSWVTGALYSVWWWYTIPSMQCMVVPYVLPSCIDCNPPPSTVTLLYESIVAMVQIAVGAQPVRGSHSGTSRPRIDSPQLDEPRDQEPSLRHKDSWIPLFERKQTLSWVQHTGH